MKKFIVKRVAFLQDGTFGVILDEGIPFALTLEREWLNNEKGKSCIPAGIYLTKRVNSPKFGTTFEVVNVPGRDAILFHKGNIIKDTEGCIVIGEQYEPVGERKIGVLSSAKGFGEFLERTKTIDEFILEIINV